MAETQTVKENHRHDIREWQAKQSKDTLREVASMGGQAIKAKYHRRKQMRQLLSDAMIADVPDAEIRQRLEDAGYDPTFENALTLSVLLKAALGDVEAIRFVRDTLGEKPTEQYNLSVSDKPIQALNLAEYSDQQLLEMAEKAEGLPPTSD